METHELLRIAAEHAARAHEALTDGVRAADGDAAAAIVLAATADAQIAVAYERLAQAKESYADEQRGSPRVTVGLVKVGEAGGRHFYGPAEDAGHASIAYVTLTGVDYAKLIRPDNLDVRIFSGDIPF